MPQGTGRVDKNGCPTPRRVGSTRGMKRLRWEGRRHGSQRFLRVAILPISGTQGRGFYKPLSVKAEQTSLLPSDFHLPGHFLDVLARDNSLAGVIAPSL